MKPILAIGGKMYFHHTVVADILGCSLRTVNRHIQKPRGLKAHRIMGHVYILEEHLAEYIKSCQQRGEAF